MVNITINNWDKYNPRKDRENFSWFRLNNDLFTDQALFSLNASQQRLFIFLLCERSKRNKGLFQLLPSYIGALLRYPEAEVLIDLSALSLTGLISADAVVTPLNDGEVPANSRPTNEQTIQDKQDKQDRVNEAPPAAPPPNLISLWNSSCGKLPKIERLTKNRKTQWEARWKEESSESYWESIIIRLALSNFCTGQNDRGWKASVDFLLKPDTHVKIAEGKYDNNPQVRRQTFAEANEAHLKEMFQKVEAGVL